MARPKVYSDDLREQLLDAAQAVVSEHGLSALSVREIAERANTSTSAVYTLLGSKAALTTGVLVRAFTSFAQRQESAADQPDVLKALGANYIAWALENPRLYELMFGSAIAGIPRTAELDTAAADAITPLRNAVTEAIETGRFRADADVDTVVVSLWSQVHGMSMLLLSKDFPDNVDLTAAAMAVIDGWTP